MSTRCQIGFYDYDNDNFMKPNALLYRHSDGHPEGPHGVIIDIVPFLKEFDRRRGLDCEYAAAWLMHHLIDKHIAMFKKIRKRNLEDRGNTDIHEDGKNFLGHGIDNYFHGDIAYYYAIKITTDGKKTTGAKLTVYECNMPFDDEEISEKCFTKFREVNITRRRKAVA